MQDLLQEPQHGRSQSQKVGSDPPLTNVDQVVKDPSNYMIIRKAERLDDEIKLRKIIHDQVTPVIGIIKENMVTNCYKNDQLKNAREDMLQINERQQTIKEDLKKVDAVQEEMLRIEKRLHFDIRKVEERFRPVVKQISELQRQDIAFENQVKAIEIQQQSHEKKFEDLEALIQKSYSLTNQEIKAINTNLQTQVDSLIPQISSIRDDCLDYYQQVESFKGRFDTIDKDLLDSQKKQFRIISSINNLREQEVHSLKKSIQKVDLKCEQYDLIIKKSDEKIAECQKYVEETRKIGEEFYKLQPFMSAMQISDYMQEFLCAPDQLKLVEFDNKKLKNLKEFADEVHDFGEYFSNLEKLREMLQTKRLGLLRVDFVKDLVLNETKDLGREELIYQGLADVKINPRKKFTNFSQKLEFTSANLLNSHKRKTQSYALEKQIINVNKKLKHIKKKKAEEEKKKQDAAKDPQALMKACPLLNFGAKMLDILDLEQMQREKEKRNKSADSGSSNEEIPDPKSRRNTMVNPNQKSSKKTVSFPQDQKQPSSNAFSAPDHSLYHQLHAQVQNLQKKLDELTAEDESDHDSSSSDGDDSDSEKKLRQNDEQPSSAAKSTAHQNRQQAILEQIMKQNAQKEEKLSVQRELLIKQIDQLMNTQLQCSKCGFKNSKLDQMEECVVGSEEDRLPLKKNNHGVEVVQGFSSGYVGSGLPNTLTKVVYIKGQSKIDKFQYRFYTKRRNEISQQFNPIKRYQNELKKALKREKAEFEDYLEYQSVEEQNLQESSKSIDLSQDNSCSNEPLIQIQNLTSKNTASVNSLVTDESLKKSDALGSVKKSLDGAKKAQQKIQLQLDELQEKRAAYWKKLGGLNDQIALMIVHEQQSIANQGLLKQDILQKQLGHELLLNLRESLLNQVNQGKITKTLAKEIYDQRFEELNFKNSVGVNKQELLIEEGPAGDRLNLPRQSSAMIEYVEDQGPRFNNLRINQHQNQMSSASNGLISQSPKRVSEPFKLTLTNSSRGGQGSHLTSGLRKDEVTLLINKALKKNEELLSKKLRHEIGGEIKQLLNISKTKMVEDQRKVFTRYDNHLSKLKESLQSLDSFTRNKLDRMETTTSNLQTEFYQINEEFQKQVEINRKVKSSQQQCEKSIKEFMKKLKVDYLDFFSDKTKMKQELNKTLFGFQEFKEISGEWLKRQDGQIERQRKLLQILAQQSSYISSIVGQDIQERQMMVERMNKQQVKDYDKNLVLNANSRGKSAKLGILKQEDNSNFTPSAIKYENFDKSNKQGSLFLKQLRYRNCDIESFEFLNHLILMEQSMQVYFEQMVDSEKELHQGEARKQCQTVVNLANNTTFDLGDRKISTKLGPFNVSPDKGLDDLLISIQMNDIQEQQKFDTVSYDQKPQRVFDDLILGKDINFEKNKFADKINEINQNPFVNVSQFESLSQEALNKSRYKEKKPEHVNQKPSSNISRLTSSKKIDVKSQSIFRQDNQRDQAITESLCNIQGNLIGKLTSSGSGSRRSSYRLNTKISNNLDKSVLQSESKNRKFFDSSLKTSTQTKLQNKTTRYIPQKLQRNSRNLPLIQTSKNPKAPRMFNTFQSTQNNVKSQIQSLRSTTNDAPNAFDSNMKSSSIINNRNFDRGLVSVQKNLNKSSESLVNLNIKRESPKVHKNKTLGSARSKSEEKYEEGDTDIVDNQSGSLLNTRGKNSKDEINFNDELDMFDSKSYGL